MKMMYQTILSSRRSISSSSSIEELRCISTLISSCIGVGKDGDLKGSTSRKQSPSLQRRGVTTAITINNNEKTQRNNIHQRHYHHQSFHSLSHYAKNSNNNTRKRCSISNDTNIRTNSTNTRSQYSPKTLVIGSSGTLGTAVTSHLKTKNHVVIGADVIPPKKDTSINSTDDFIFLSPECSSSISTMIQTLSNGLDDTGIHNLELDAVICAAGGFAMDNDVQSAEGGTVFDFMMAMNYFPAVAAGEIARMYMKKREEEGGLVVIMGALASLSPTPGMLAYGSSKAAVHHYVQSLGNMTGRALVGQQKFKKDVVRSVQQKQMTLDGMTVVGLCPRMLDTPSNREAMPDDNFDSWTKPKDVAMEIGTWLETPQLRPHSGSLVNVLTKKRPGGDDFVTEFHLAR